MNFSKTTEYAFRIMSLMAMDETHLYTAEELYVSLQIPFRYLRKLMTSLGKSGIIESVQGKYGGYRIAGDISQISLMDIIQAAGDEYLSNECFFGFKTCAFEKKCAMHERWGEVRTSVGAVLEKTMLADIRETGTDRFLTVNSHLLTKSE